MVATWIPLIFPLILFSFSILSTGADDCGCLKLTPFIKNGSTELARTLSRVDPSQFLNVTSHSGFLTVNEEYDSNIFFWFFPHKEAARRPWMIWLQGGPGCSSLYGLFHIIGPFHIVDEELHPRNVTWASDYSLLFVDNPVGAGYSYTKDKRGLTTNEDQVGEQLYDFLVQFLKIFPEMRKAPLFIAGESYAGKYVPAFGIQIHRHRYSTNETINFKGMSIGNGLIDPRSQMNYTELCGVMGIVEGVDLIKLKQIETDVVRFIDAGRMIDAANKFNETIEFIKEKSGVNIFNFNRNPSKGAPEYEAFLNRSEVQRAIHVGNVVHTFNNQTVYQSMLPDIMNTTRPFLEELLEHYGVLSYSGQLDVILPYGLSKHLYDVLEWSGRDEYTVAPRECVRLSKDGPIAAYKKSGGNFVEVLIRLAGHMVPNDQPYVARHMIRSFINQFKN
ncbi:vitellogenic carboxypeptidase-like isoform X2 [Ostrinia nubilalis]|uniref:vitellogenic carboxypeptidase-like isoform X2 n=1 Tax=Ostrinia nubilalis TaxID=29057 RepID=UPI003082580C